MLLSLVLTLCFCLSFLVALYLGQGQELAQAVMAGAGKGVEILISMAGGICLWSGLVRLWEASGVSALLQKIFSPLLGRIFPRTAQDPKTMKLLCGNFTANLLGLGNAATPMGIRCVMGMKQGDTATDEMCRLIVLNTASIQLIPTNVAAIRASLGCVTPFDILPAVWITSLCSALLGISAAWFLGKVRSK